MTKPLTRSERKRSDIMKAARLAFEQDGFHNTSMDKLAALAQVSKRTVYNHFESKEALLMELLKELWLQAMQQQEISYSQEQPLAEQLLGLVEAEVELICTKEYIELMRVALGHYFYQPEALQKEMTKYAAIETSLTRWLTAAIADERLKPVEVELATEQLHSLIKGTGLWLQLFRIKPILTQVERQNLAEQTVSLFLSRYQVV